MQKKYLVYKEACGTAIGKYCLSKSDFRVKSSRHVYTIHLAGENQFFDGLYFFFFVRFLLYHTGNKINMIYNIKI